MRLQPFPAKRKFLAGKASARLLALFGVGGTKAVLTTRNLFMPLCNLNILFFLHHLLKSTLPSF